MPDRVVYLVSATPKRAGESNLEFVSDDELSQLLANGWEVSTTLPDRVVKVAGKSVKTTMLILRLAAENRGLALRDPARERPPGGSMITLPDDFGGSQSMEPGRAISVVLQKMSRALVNLGESGHLGSARDHNMPGLQIISGEHISKAWDMGQMAARRGDSVDTCPWDPGTEVAQRWLRGFRTAEKSKPQEVNEVSAQEARQLGLTTAQEFGIDDQVTCPYPPGSPLREHWIAGFKSGGGRVEG